MKKILFYVCVLVLSFVLWSCHVGAEPISFSWKANTEADLSHYNFYRGDKSGEYDNAINVGNTTSYIAELSKGVHYVIVTAVDTSGNESVGLYEIKYEIFISPVTGLGSP